MTEHNQTYKRVETGVVLFDDDWPGVFIRGDDAFAFGIALQGLDSDDPMIQSLIKLFDSCIVGERFADHIQRLRAVWK
jgi:hypothetical protein